jgi:hypothetical protein
MGNEPESRQMELVVVYFKLSLYVTKKNWENPQENYQDSWFLSWDLNPEPLKLQNSNFDHLSMVFSIITVIYNFNIF